MPKTPGLGEGNVAYLVIKVRHLYLSSMFELFTDLLGFIHVNQEETEKPDHYELLDDDAGLMLRLQSATNYEQSSLKSAGLVIYANDPTLVGRNVQLWAKKHNLEFDMIIRPNGEVRIVFPLVLGVSLTFIPTYM